MKKLSNFIFSFQLSGILLMVLIVFSAMATFIENDYGTTAAKAIIYNSTWFEILLLLLAINILGSIFKYKLFRKAKIGSFIFHLSFVIMIIGAGFTKHFGYTGNMRIREGKASNIVQTHSSYLKFSVKDASDSVFAKKKILLSGLTNNRFSKKVKINDKKLKFKTRKYIPNAFQEVVEDKNGDLIVELAYLVGKNKGEYLYLENNKTTKFNSVKIGLNNINSNNTIDFKYKNGILTFICKDSVSFFNMNNGNTETIAPDELFIMRKNIVYRIKNLSLVLSNIYPKAKIQYLPSQKAFANSKEILIVEANYNGKKRNFNVVVGENLKNTSAKNKIDDINISISYSPLKIKLPFSLYLEDFILSRYSGSNSPSSYQSNVILIDENNNTKKDYKIFMNNVLSYKGFRFFQSSYDQDEKGTVLSVNHDIWGTSISYLSYFLLTLGMILSLFNKNSRFALLLRASKKIRKSRELLILVAIASLFFIPSKTANAQDSISQKHLIKVEHAHEFGKLLVLDQSNRIQSVSTLSSKILRKLSRKTKFKELIPEQVILGMLSDPFYWQDVKIIKISNPELKKILNSKDNFVSFNDIVDYKNQDYKISKYLTKALKKKSSERNKFDKEVVKIDEKINICYMLFTASIMQIFPVKSGSSTNWISIQDAKELNTKDSIFISRVFQKYLTFVKIKNWDKANIVLKEIKNYQKEIGGDSIPSDNKIFVETKYNQLNVFKRIILFYLFIGLILLVLQFIKIFNQKIKLNLIEKILSFLIIALFIVHSSGLAARWYISGHAPWSNSYESMLFIAWSAVLSGLVFFARSKMTLPIASMIAALTLFVANLNWLDPEITNLIPVLKSFWLIIHVAIITSSYGFLALGTILGFTNLILLAVRTKANKERVELSIKEFTILNETTIIIGLILLTIGTFLGAVWANESWGRYWGWDPKETWALISMLVYTFVLHLRFIPGLRGKYAFNLGSLIAYASILMTYFGVNYYLSGLHSYAQGDPVPIPSFVYYTIAVIAIISILAYIKEWRLGSLKKIN